MKPHLNGVLWPTYWLYDKSDESAAVAFGKIPPNVPLPDRIIKIKFIMSQDVLFHVANICTFGICSPFLATIITVCLIMKLFIWVVVLGRFLSFRSNPQGNEEDSRPSDRVVSIQLHTRKSSIVTIEPPPVIVDDAVVALGDSCVDFLEVFDVTLWPILRVSSLFFAILVFDIAGDELVSL